MDQVAWPTVERYIRSHWKQGEHVTIVGPTGCGKTTFEARMLPRRKFVVVFVTKFYDKTISRDFKDYERIVKWPPKLTQNRVLLWPEQKDTMRESVLHQRQVFGKALNSIFKERNWCIVFDEQHYMCEQLGLSIENAMLLQQGRSSGLSVVNGTQRPSRVPVVTWSSAAHAFIWRTTFRDDLKRLAEIGGIDQRELQRNILSLDKHAFLYVNTRKGDAFTSSVAM